MHLLNVTPSPPTCTAVTWCRQSQIHMIPMLTQPDTHRYPSGSEPIQSSDWHPQVLRLTQNRHLTLLSHTGLFWKPVLCLFTLLPPQAMLRSTQPADVKVILVGKQQQSGGPARFFPHHTTAQVQGTNTATPTCLKKETLFFPPKPAELDLL